MPTRTLSSHKLIELATLARTPALKAKASITLSGNLLKVIDTLAGTDQRSAWIERAVRAYAKRQLKGFRLGDRSDRRRGRRVETSVGHQLRPTHPPRKELADRLRW